jgi:hypothetical protein
MNFTKESFRNMLSFHPRNISCESGLNENEITPANMKISHGETSSGGAGRTI